MRKDKVLLMAVSMLSVLLVMAYYSQPVPNDKAEGVSQNQNLKLLVGSKPQAKALVAKISKEKPHPLNKSIITPDVVKASHSDLPKKRDGLSLIEQNIKSKKYNSTDVHHVIKTKNRLPTSTSSKIKAFSVSTKLSTESNTREINTQGHHAETTLSIEPSYTFSNNMIAAIKLSGTQVHGKEQLSVLDNTELTLTHTPYKFNRDFQVVPVLKGVIATNYLDKQAYSYQGSTSLGLDLIQSSNILGSPITIAYSAGYLRNFHEFTRAADDRANLIDYYSFGLGLLKPIGQSIKISLGSTALLTKTYQGTDKTIFVLSQSISYALGKESPTAISIGHYNKANALKADGQNSNVAVYDDQSSIFYGAISHTF